MKIHRDKIWREIINVIISGGKIKWMEIVDEIDWVN